MFISWLLLFHVKDFACKTGISYINQSYSKQEMESFIIGISNRKYKSSKDLV